MDRFTVYRNSFDLIDTYWNIMATCAYNLYYTQHWNSIDIIMIKLIIIISFTLANMQLEQIYNTNLFTHIV